MGTTEPSRRELAFAVGGVLFVSAFLVAVGTGLLPVHLDRVLADPGWRRLVEICVLRVLPLWTALLLLSLAALSLYSYRTRGRVRLPGRTRRAILYVNLVVLTLAAFAFQHFAARAPGAASDHWFWRAVLTIFLGGTVFLIAFVRREMQREISAATRHLTAEHAEDAEHGT